MTFEVLIYQGTTCHVFLREMEGDVKMKLGFKKTGSLEVSPLSWSQFYIYIYNDFPVVLVQCQYTENDFLKQNK